MSGFRFLPPANPREIVSHMTDNDEEVSEVVSWLGGMLANPSDSIVSLNSHEANSYWSGKIHESRLTLNRSESTNVAGVSIIQPDAKVVSAEIPLEEDK